jgi:flagellar biosynthesis protein FlhG
MNQAQTLIEMTKRMGSSALPMTTLAITSGKGGVGKTNVVVNLAVSLTRRGYRVLLLDADFGLGNIDILLGVDPVKDISDLLYKGAPIEDVLIEYEGVSIIPAASGVQSLAEVTSEQEENLHQALSGLSNRMDLLMIDTAAGISDNVISLLLSSDDIILVVSTEPTSIVDAYAVIKVMRELDADKRFWVVANMVEDADEGSELFRKLANAAQRFLGKHINYLTHIRRDKKIIEAVRAQQPVVTLFPQAGISRDFSRLSLQLIEKIGLKKKEHKKRS